MKRILVCMVVLLSLTAALTTHAQDSLNVTMIGHIDTPGSALGVAVSGNYAYIADELSGLRVIDISDPSDPVETGFYDTPGYAFSISVLGGYAYVANGNGLLVIDISDPSNPEEVGFYDTPDWARSVAVSGDYAYVADRFRGLRVIDISDPSDPDEVGYYDTPNFAHGVAVSGDYAYVADGPSGLRVIDISDPTDPYEIGFYDTPGDANGVAVSSIYAYVADYGSGLRVIDISIPTDPEEVGFYDTPGVAYGVDISGSYAYVADGNSGLRVINVSDPSNPDEIGFYDTPGVAYGVAVSGVFVYIADSGQGLEILRYGGFQPVEPTGLQYTIIVNDAQIGEEPVVWGDEIAVFDGVLCVGAVHYEGQWPLTLTAFQANPANGLPGFTPGNEMYFRIWSLMLDMESPAEAEYTLGDGAFGFFPLSQVSLQGQITTLIFPDFLNFTAWVGDSTTIQMPVINTGEDEGMISSISSNNPRFHIVDEEQTIEPGDTLYIPVTFAPIDTIIQASDLQISCNDPVQAIVHVPLYGDVLFNIEENLSFMGNFFELISLYVTPNDLDAGEIFGAVADLVIVYQDNGGMYIPPPLNINTIGEVDVTRGYQVFCSENSELIVSGVSVPSVTEYSISAGPWNWIGYPYLPPTPVVTALSAITDAVEIVVTDDGRIWIPALNINTLGDMQAGEGYMVIVSEDVTFQYNPGDPGLAAAPGPSPAGGYDSTLGSDVWEIPEVAGAPRPTGLPYAVIVSFNDDLKTLDPAVIELYDGDLLVGKAVVLDDHEVTPVIAWGGSEEHGVPGFRKGDAITVRLLRADGSEIPITASINAGELQGESPGEALYGEGAFTSLALDLDESALPAEFSVGAAYPNPFNPTVTVPFALPHNGEVHFAVFNLLGREVFSQSRRYNAGHHRFTMDAANTGNSLVSGVYFLQIQYEGNVSTQKLMLLK